MMHPPLRAPLSVVVVDDEPPARRRLIQMLAGHENARVVAEASSIAEARAQLERHDPDLVLLDVELSREDGFSLLDRECSRAAVVFVTAHAQYAARAFEFEVLDYLLKPVRPERLAAALRRAEARREQMTGGREKEAAEAPLALQTRQGIRIAPVADVVCIAARDDHSELFLRDGSSHFDPTHMDEWERRLPPCFVRTHRSHIANLKVAVGFARRENGWALQVGAHVLPISRSRLHAIRLALDLKPH